MVGELCRTTSSVTGKYKFSDRGLVLAVLDGVTDGAEVLAAGLD